MLRRFPILLAFLVAATLLSARVSAATPGKVVAAYYSGGTVARYPVETLPADTLTHLFYAFAGIRDGQCSASPESGTHFAALAKLKREHPKLRTIISIGGWNAGGFSDAALTDASRKRLVSSCMTLFFDRNRGSFDGVDLDWEFPVSGGPKEIAARAEDRRNMTLLMREFRRDLDALGKRRGQHFLLTAALPGGRMESAGPYDPAQSYELAAVAKLLDFINLMSYDMGTTFSPVASFNSPLRGVPADPLAPELRRWNSVEGAVEYYRAHGVPADKIVVGVPFYGRGYRVTSDANDGLYQSYSGTYPAGDWRLIKAKLLTDPQWQQHWHPVAQSPWLFNAKEHVFVSYEDPRSIGIRAKFAHDRGLRGVFTWELAGDDDDRSLLKAMAQPFK
ncbi:glycoside hydrolase family 18 protein [Solilutibacter silvestris]|uniref:glycoside hydrolase family 18 protein n=1 Tax=Solilutibacter silvestris TaxID=1645665 RepID=UPI003D33E767